MVVYFTATGNSQYAAEKIAAAANDRLLDMGRAVRRGDFRLELKEGEPLGFVFPVFAWTLPGIVELFLRKMEVTGYAGQYVYGVFTCGESSGHTGAALASALKERGITLNYAATLVMPDNYIIWSNIPPKERLERMLDAADGQLKAIVAAIAGRDNKPPAGGRPEMMCLPLEPAEGGRIKLWVTDKCTGCGLCRAICPMGCIRQSGTEKPVWEGLCTQCLACLHRCPAGAIEWGRETMGKIRYANPRVKLAESYEG